MCNVCSNITASLFLSLVVCDDGWECFGGYLSFTLCFGADENISVRAAESEGAQNSPLRNAWLWLASKPAVAWPRLVPAQCLWQPEQP